MRRTAKAHETTVRDLMRERASALSKVTEELEAALLALARADAALPSPGAAAHRREALLHAGERLWCLVVQRESMGLTRHEVLDDVLRIPKEVHLAMGPRGRRR